MSSPAPVRVRRTAGPTFFDAVTLINTSPLYLNETIVFSAEAPGTVIAVVRNEYGIKSDPSIIATWRDVPGGYQIEARIPASRLGTHLGVVVYNTASELQSPARSATFTSRKPAAFVTVSPDLSRITDGLAQPGMRLAVTDTSGWRIAASGDLSTAAAKDASVRSIWLRVLYDALVESGAAAELAETGFPVAANRRDYISQALAGEESAGWFRSGESGRAVVAVAQPVIADGELIGAFVLQQGTDAILSLRNQGLVRLMNVTLIATLLVAATLTRIRDLALTAHSAGSALLPRRRSTVTN